MIIHEFFKNNFLVDLILILKFILILYFSILNLQIESKLVSSVLFNETIHLSDLIILKFIQHIFFLIFLSSF